jgi:hypothetical protein
LSVKNVIIAGCPAFHIHAAVRGATIGLRREHVRRVTMHRPGHEMTMGVDKITVSSIPTIDRQVLKGCPESIQKVALALATLEKVRIIDSDTAEAKL